jgi:hypothetical protein
MLGRGAVPTKPSSPSPEEDEDELIKSLTAEFLAEFAEIPELPEKFWDDMDHKKNEDGKELDMNFNFEDFRKPSPARVFKSMLRGAYKAVPGCLALFPLDTIRTRLQATNSEQLLTSGKRFHSLYDGLGPALVYAAFLGAYEDIRTDLPLMFSLPAIRAFTDFLVRVPFEVSNSTHDIHDTVQLVPIPLSPKRCLCVCDAGGEAASAGGLGQDVAGGHVVSHDFQGADGLLYGLGGDGTEGPPRVLLAPPVARHVHVSRSQVTQGRPAAFGHHIIIDTVSRGPHWVAR